MSCMFFGCQDGVTYAEQLKQEQKLIAEYIKRNNIKVVKTMPTDWTDENLYYLSPSGLYFRLVDVGDTAGLAVEKKDLITPRYTKYTLGVNSDTVHKENTIHYPHPKSFYYLDISTEGKALHEAVGYMKFNDSRAKLIVHSKIGDAADENSVTPYGYDFSIKIQK